MSDFYRSASRAHKLWGDGGNGLLLKGLELLSIGRSYMSILPLMKKEFYLPSHLPILLYFMAYGVIFVFSVPRGYENITKVFLAQ